MYKKMLHIGVPRGAYPERQYPLEGRIESFTKKTSAPIWRQVQMRSLRTRRLVGKVRGYGKMMSDLTTSEIFTTARGLRTELRQEGLALDIVSKTFALVREAADRTLGMRHFDVQLMGGWILINGMIAEMETGEGKTLTATLPACTMALSGVPVHIITVNDYLARRDAEEMRPIYEAFGLTVGVISHGMYPEERRSAYGCDVTYCTNKEVVFDYLKDRIVLGRDPRRFHLQLERLSEKSPRLQRLFLRGLCFAIVDEADSVLVDEARTPLIISGGGNNAPEQDVYETALSIAKKLQSKRDFIIEERERSLSLTDTGRKQLADLVQEHQGVWTGQQRREDLIRKALTAVHLMHRDTHYLLKDNKVQIIDEYTGRVMADRSWENGLHQLIETKEGCPLTGMNEPLARISYQRFFRRYLRLGGMTGTARELRSELWSVYQLAVVSVPTNKRLRRKDAGTRIYVTASAKWDAVVARIRHLHQCGCPILAGTRSVASSEHLSALLTTAELPHEVLNARQDKGEAEIIARAGEAGRITVATNMAGRGTDIRLLPSVAEQGGLYVIATEGHEASRIDRQLFGRCGRQGDPGSYEMLSSLEDELLATYASGLLKGFRVLKWHSRIWGGKFLLRSAQRTAERTHSRIRRDLLKMDEHLDVALAFSGRRE